MKIIYLLIACCFPLMSESVASDTIVIEPDGKSYSHISHYEQVIAAPKAQVWQHLTDFKTWMYAFDMKVVSGEARQLGAVYKLYAGQDFQVQITALDEGNLIVLSNLPASFQGERTTGVNAITLTEMNDVVRVNLIMSRRFTPVTDTDSTMLKVRLSSEFQAKTGAMWQGFLARLQELSEG